MPFRLIARRSRVALLVLAAAFACCPPTLAGGDYRMPSSLPQCLGYGSGPGYHAPLLLGPAIKARVATQRVKRLPAPMSPRSAPAPDMGFGASSLWLAP